MSQNERPNKKPTTTEKLFILGTALIVAPILLLLEFIPGIYLYALLVIGILLCIPEIISVSRSLFGRRRDRP